MAVVVEHDIDVEQGQGVPAVAIEDGPSTSNFINHPERVLPSKVRQNVSDTSNNNEGDAGAGESHDDDDHGHAANPSFKSFLASSVVCFIIYFVFCIVFSSVVWDPLNSSLDPNINPPFGIAQGVGINLMGIAVGSVFFAWKSGCKAIIAGPDLLPVVFFAEAGTTVVTYLAAQSAEALKTSCADGAAADTGHRFLGGGYAADSYADADPCDQFHRHLAGEELYLDKASIAKVVPTTLVSMIIGNLVTALVFYGLGKAKSTARVIGCIPSSVVAGFLTCIGYKVIKLAVLITTGFSFKEKYVKNLGLDYWHRNDPWLPLFLALVYGIALYAFKHLHIVSADKLILGFIFVPLILFFIVITASGASMEYLRETGWFLTQARDGQGCVENCAFVYVDFWQTLQVTYGGIASNLVAWSAVPRCIPLFVMGAVMTSLDNMLKLTSSEKGLGIDLNYNHEIKLGGKATIFSSFLAGSPAYGQTKFNVINLSIAGTSESFLPTLHLGCLCMLLFLSGVAGNIINIMPRFLLGGLCVFSGVGFLYENLWEGRKKMSRASFAIVWIIFLVNFIWEFFVLQNLPKDVQPMVPGLLVVFVLGIVLSVFEFMFAFMHKAKDPSIRGGDVCCSSAVRSDKHDKQLAIMAGWFHVFKVDSFIFFGTANTLYQQLKAHISEQKESKPRAERTKYLIFDLTEVTGIDSSARDVFYKVHRLLKSEGISLVWAIRNPQVGESFDDQGLYVGATHFDSLDHALRHVEDELLRKAHNLSQKWLKNGSVREIFERQVLKSIFNISVRAEEKNFSPSRLQPWSKISTLSIGTQFGGADDDNLYLLYSGEVRVHERDGSHFDCLTGSFFNLDNVLVSIGVLSGLPSTVSAVVTKESAILAISKKNYLLMQKQDPPLAQKLQHTLLAQQEANRPGRTRARVPYRDSSVASEEPVAIHGLAKRLLQGNDYKISLTKKQIARFSEVFELILEPGENEIPMNIFSSYVSMEARLLGSAFSHEEFMELIDGSGIDEDGDGSLTKDEFLTFLRGLFLSDIPSTEVEALRQAYEKAAALAPMDDARLELLFKELGFDMNSSNLADVIGVIDADCDGMVDFNEFMTGIGMMKKMTLLSKQLASAFRQYKNFAMLKRCSARSGNQAPPSRKNLFSLSLHAISDREFKAVPSRKSLVSSSLHAMSISESEHQSAPAPAPRRRSFLSSSLHAIIPNMSSGQLNGPQTQDEVFDEGEGCDELDASDLMAFLKVEREEAEEMVFLADQDEVTMVKKKESVVHSTSTGESEKCYRSIDSAEFQQLIRTWS